MRQVGARSEHTRRQWDTGDRWAHKVSPLAAAVQGTCGESAHGVGILAASRLLSLRQSGEVKRAGRWWAHGVSIPETFCTPSKFAVHNLEKEESGGDNWAHGVGTVVASAFLWMQPRSRR